MEMLAIQILYNGHHHWVTVVCTEGKLYLCDNLASEQLTQTLKSQHAVTRGGAACGR